MTVNISFYDYPSLQYIKQWPNWRGVVPVVGDLLLLHFGDNNEETCGYVVQKRLIDGTAPDYILIYIERIKEENSHGKDSQKWQCHHQDC
jgi:hypothetical protein